MSINTAHCSACGVDPFDKTYSIGYEVGHKDWSPYPRVNNLRKAFLEREYLIDVEPQQKSDAPEHLKKY